MAWKMDGKSKVGEGIGAAAGLRAFAVALRALAALALIAPGMAAAAPLRIVADIAPVHGLVSLVAEGAGSPDLLIDQQASPHGYAMRPSEARMLERADVVIHVGGGLAPWLERAVERLAADARILELIDVPATVRHDFRTAGLFGEETGAHAGGHDGDGEQGHGHEDGHGKEESHGHDDHGHGHEDEQGHGHEDEQGHGHEDGHGKEEAHGHDDHGHEPEDEHGHEDGHGHDEEDDHGHDEHGHGHDHAGGVDPHAWLDIENGIVWLDAIAGALAKADPENADLYRSNAAAGQARLAGLADEIDGRLRPHRNTPYVVFHDAYQYFERRYGLAALGAISLHDAASPGPARLAGVRDGIARHGVSCVFSEPQFSGGLIDAVTRGRAVRTAVIDPLGAELPLGPRFYEDLLSGISIAVAGCLGSG